MNPDQDRGRLEQAFSSAEPSAALQQLANTLKSEGVGQVAMYHLFNNFQRKMDPDDPRRDAILDVIDLIWGGGWAKGRALFPTELSGADIVED